MILNFKNDDSNVELNTDTLIVKKTNIQNGSIIFNLHMSECVYAGKPVETIDKFFEMIMKDNTRPAWKLEVERYVEWQLMGVNDDNALL